MSLIKTIFILFFCLNFIKSNDESISIKAKYFPKSNTIIYNGKKFTLSSNELFEEEDFKIPNVHLTKKRILLEAQAKPFSAKFWFNLIIFIVLACFAGTMSGLTVGYLSIDSLVLEIKMTNGTENEKYYAEKIYKLVDNHHWLLVTLLLCNSFACEAMPIFLSKLVNEMMAIVLSVTVLLFVGEIIPQALCTGPNQMKIASILAPFTYILMIVTYPISFPIAKFMDYVIGVHGKNRFCNSDLKSIIELHVKEMLGELSAHQLGYFTGFLDIMNKKVGELILPIEKTLKLDYHAKITKVTLKRLINSGYSRIPIYENHANNLIGILRMKELVGKDLSKSYTLSQLGINLSNPIRVYEDTLFLDLFERFKGGKSHMAFIHQKESPQNFFNSISSPMDPDKKFERNMPNSPIKGIITLEDLIEFWLKIPILDEEDYLHSDEYKKRISKRKKTFLDIITSEKLHDKINKLYDSKSPIRKSTKNLKVTRININEISNNYYPLNDKNENDDENEKLIFK